MNSCARCGEKMSHNYLSTVFTVKDEIKKKVVVCLKCKGIFEKGENKAGRGNGGDRLLKVQAEKVLL